jgi:hypothetical protein
VGGEIALPQEIGRAVIRRVLHNGPPRAKWPS